jgi:hypothetical protein
MNQRRFDAMGIAAAGDQTRRTALWRVFGGGLAALLATAGLGLADDAVSAKSRCKHRCHKKHSRNKRRQCRKRCDQGNTLIQQGTAELVRLSTEDCAALGTCRDSVFGVISGAPITDGTFTGVMTGTSIRGDETSITVDFSGTLVAAERVGADTIGATLALSMTQQRAPAGQISPFTFSGTSVIAGGTGRFTGVTGDGTITGDGIRPFGGAEGTVQSFRMDGNYQLNTKS